MLLIANPYNKIINKNKKLNEKFTIGGIFYEYFFRTD